MSAVSMIVRKLNNESDSVGLRDCMIELQNFERNIDARMPSGEDIADEYIVEMLHRCHQCDGQVLVADVDGDIAGYVTILNRVQSDDLDDGNIEFGLVADLVVRKEFRGSGLGKDLMEAAEQYARDNDVRWLRISVMAANRGARDLYAALGFDEIYIELEKDLGHPDSK
ncbi:MAG: GNAT family N-acetyltransferase [Woeseiaceae bacterium]